MKERIGRRAGGLFFPDERIGGERPSFFFRDGGINRSSIIYTVPMRSSIFSSKHIATFTSLSKYSQILALAKTQFLAPILHLNSSLTSCFHLTQKVNLMPRKARICVPGAVHYVTSRVVRDQVLFRTQQDKEKFQKLLQYFLKITGFILYHIDYYETHYHMVLRINHLPLSALFKGLHSAYALYYNRKYNLSGYFFRERPKSVVVEDGDKFRELIRYTNTGPIRAGLCKTLEELDIFPCTHAALMGSHNLPLLETNGVLSVFNDRTNTASKDLYRQFISKAKESNQVFLDLIKGVNRAKQNMHEPGYWIIGSKKFVKEAIDLYKIDSVRISDYRAAGWDHEELAKFIFNHTKVPFEQLLKKSRSTGPADAKKLFCYFAVEILRMRKIDVATHLKISTTAVNRLARLGESIAKDKQLNLPSLSAS